MKGELLQLQQTLDMENNRYDETTCSEFYLENFYSSFLEISWNTVNLSKLQVLHLRFQGHLRCNNKSNSLVNPQGSEVAQKQLWADLTRVRSEKSQLIFPRIYCLNTFQG